MLDKRREYILERKGLVGQWW